MIEYFKNAKVYKLQYSHISSLWVDGHMTQFWYNYVKGQGHMGA